MAETAVYKISSSHYTHLVSLLLPHLPSFIVLIRQLQWQHSPTCANIFTTFPIITPYGTPISNLPRVFAIARLDRTAFRGTGLFISSSLELTALSPFTHAETITATTALLNLCSHLHRLDQPPHLSNHEGDVLLAGHLHTTTAHLLQQHNLIASLTNPNNNSKPGPFDKFVIRYHRTSKVPSLPPGMDYTTITPKDYALVMQENKLIHSIKTFDNTPTAAIRLTDISAFTQHQMGKASNDTAAKAASAHTGQIIAWAIITSYGSIRTLHVQPAFRGLGLARKVVLRLLETAWPAEFVNQQGDCRSSDVVFHTDIDPGNQASIRTFAPIGEVLQVSSCYWVDVDLGRAEMASQIL